MELSRISPEWDGSSPPKTIHCVWNYVSFQLRNIRDMLRQSTDEFYGKHERLLHTTIVNDALRLATDANYHNDSIGNFSDLDKLANSRSSSSISPRSLSKAQEVLRLYREKINKTVSKLNDLKGVFERDVLDILEMYCSNYMKLGIQDDKYFKKLRSRTLRIRDNLRDYIKVSGSLTGTSSVVSDYFCHDEFSETIAIKYDCDKFPILRVVPDLIQKCEHVCTIAQDWLRSDKVYLEEVRQQIQKTKDRMKETSGECHSTKLKYERLFALLKQKQFELDDYDETFELTCKDIAQLECKKTRLEIEIHAVAKALRGCREQIRDLRSVSLSRQQSEDCDGVDGMAPESEEELEEEEKHTVRGMGHAHTSYRTRLCRDARSHNVKLDYLRRKKKKLQRKIESHKSVLREMKDNESDILALSKELRVISRKKVKLLEEISSINSHLDSLEQVLTHRLNPTSHIKTPLHGRPKRARHPRSRSKLHARSRPDSRGSVSSMSSSRQSSAGRSSKAKGHRNGGKVKRNIHSKISHYNLFQLI